MWCHFKKGRIMKRSFFLYLEFENLEILSLWEAHRRDRVIFVCIWRYLREIGKVLPNTAEYRQWLSEFVQYWRYLAEGLLRGLGTGSKWLYLSLFVCIWRCLSTVVQAWLRMAVFGGRGLITKRELETAVIIASVVFIQGHTGDLG